MELVKMMFGGKEYTIETGRMAKQANGSVVVRYGDTMVLVTACVSKKPHESLDFFPLTVDYREKAYAAGKIPGGYIKREGPPSTKEILSSRLIDRPIRPLFPEGFTHEVQVIAYVLSYDMENEADVLAITGASAALSISDIPFDGPIAGVRVGYVAGKFIANPTLSELEESEMDIVVAGNEESIVMVEGGALEIPEDLLLDALKFAHENIKELVKLQKELIAAVAKEKMDFEKQEVDPEIDKRVRELFTQKVQEANINPVKAERSAALDKVAQEAIEALSEKFPEKEDQIKYILHEIEKEHLRKLILEEEKRIDNRQLDEIRTISIETGILPRAHGSALFTRGQTQSLGVVTLGTKMDEQRIDNLEGEVFKSYMLHYNFPPFSVGEIKPVRGPGRREIGHGHLAERSLEPIIPAEEDFPYTIRIVSDILESNGSSSMATVCSGSLSLMDAGVPVKTHIAGVAMGLVKEGDNYKILTDIQGVEDHLGDMDFKVAGSRDGITGFQMDIKIKGITFDIIQDALEKAKKARMFILDKMFEAIPAPKDNLSEHAPKIVVTQIPVDKIGEVIGIGGKIIKQIQEDTETTISIDQNGVVNIVGYDEEKTNNAKSIIERIVTPPEIGAIVEGKVTKIFPFGAVVVFDFLREGLIHISEIDYTRVNDVSDFLKEGDIVRAKIIEIDDSGKIRLSRKALLDKPEGYSSRHRSTNRNTNYNKNNRDNRRRY